MPSDNAPRPSVYVVNFAGHDFTPVKAWGDLRVMFPGYIDLTKPDRILYQAVEILRESAPTDWLCLSGLLLPNVLITLAWMRRHGSLRILAWDKRMSNQTNGEQAYREVIVSEAQIDTLFEVLDGLPLASEKSA